MTRQEEITLVLKKLLYDAKEVIGNSPFSHNGPIIIESCNRLQEVTGEMTGYLNELTELRQ